MADLYNFSDLFISYSRRDKDFARKVFEQLKAQNRSVWADWEDIAPTVEWWQEIQAGIESANNFVFIISPDSVTSEVCRDEIEHALAHKKRVIPVLFREVVDKEQQAKIHPVIGSHNWIFCRDTDDFARAFTQLSGALDTDLEHTRQHTRLLVRANEWNARKRDRAYLLRGSDLTEAAEWVKNGTEKHPTPTQLQIDYIVTSRNAEFARLRNFASRVIFAMILCIILGVLAIFQAISADRAREVASNNAETAIAAVATSNTNANLAATSASIASTNEAQAFTRGTEVAFHAATADAALREAGHLAGLSQSLALAARASLELDGSSPERGVLLALEALRFYPYTTQAEQALAETVQNTHTYFYRTGMRFAAIYPPESWLAVTDTAGRAGIIDNDNNVRVLPDTGDVPVMPAWSPDGKILAMGYESGDVRLWDVATLDVIRQFHAHDEGIITVNFSPDGTRLATTGGGDSAREWDVATGDMLHELAEGYPTFQAVYSPDGQWIATAAGKQAYIWDAATGEQLVALVGHTDLMFDIAWSPDGEYLLTGNVDGTARVWSRETGSELAQVQHNGGVASVAWTLDASYFFTGGMDGELKTWDTDTLTEADSYTVSASAVTQMAVFRNNRDPQIDNILTMGQDGTLRSVSLLPFGELWQVNTPDTNLWSAAWSPDGNQFITGSRDGSARIYDFGTVEQRFILPGYEQVAWSPDGKAVAVSAVDTESGSYLLAVWDPASGKRRFQANEPIRYIVGLAFSPDSSQVAVGSRDGMLSLYDAQSGAQLKTYKLDGEMLALDWSPDGKWIAVGMVDYLATIDAATWETAHDGVDMPSPRSVAYAPDSQTLAVGTVETGDIALLDAASLEPIRSLHGHTSAVASLSWSPDGTRLLSGSDDRTVRIWDPTNGNELRIIRAHNGAIAAAAWSPNSDSILTVSKDRTVRVWRVWLTQEELMTAAENCCVVRALTPQERIQFNLPESDD